MLNTRSRRLFLLLHWELIDVYFLERKLLLNSEKKIEKKKKKMIGHHTRLRENDDLLRCRELVIKKKPPFFNVRALITREIMRSKDAQCNTKE